MAQIPDWNMLARREYDSNGLKQEDWQIRGGF